jgi:hypothetical protein
MIQDFLLFKLKRPLDGGIISYLLRKFKLFISQWDKTTGAKSKEKKPFMGEYEAVHIQRGRYANNDYFKSESSTNNDNLLCIYSKVL